MNWTEWQEKHNSSAETWVPITIFKNPVWPARPLVNLFHICQPSAGVSHTQVHKKSHQVVMCQHLSPTISVAETFLREQFLGFD